MDGNEKNGIDVSKQKDKMIPVTDATIEQVGLGFESRMDELLERLKVTEVLAAKDEKFQMILEKQYSLLQKTSKGERGNRSNTNYKISKI